MPSYLTFWGVGGEGEGESKYYTIIYWPAPGFEQATLMIAVNTVNFFILSWRLEKNAFSWNNIPSDFLTRVGGGQNNIP